MIRKLRLLVLALALAGAAGAAAARPLTVGFYLPWDAASTASAVRHAAAIDVLAPMSGALDSPQGHVRWQDDPARTALAKGRAKPRVFPVVSNAHDNVWDAAAAEAAVGDPAAGEAFVGALVAEAKAQGYGGYILDFESLSPAATQGYPAFLARLRAALRPLGREVWVTAGVAADPALVRGLAAATDAVVLMAYDQCWANSTPGPIAGQDWLARSLEASFAGADAAHYLVALGAYGYDWPDGKPAAVISAPAAVALARAKGQAALREPPAANPHFAYAGPDGARHTVWYLDAAAFAAQRAAVLARKARGVAVWRLGLEDPAIWTAPVAAQARTAPAPAGPAPPPVCFALPH